MKPLDLIWSFIGTVGLGLLGFGSLQVYQLNANVAIVSYKVDQNHEMIKPMWQDFLVRKTTYYEYIQSPNSVSSIETTKR